MTVGLWGLLGYCLWSDLRRPTVSELATVEVASLRSEVESLRRLLEEVGKDTSELERTRFWLDITFKLLLFSWAVLSVLVYLNLDRKPQRASLLALPAPALDTVQVSDSPATSSQSTPVAAGVRAGPTRPSSLKHRQRK